MPISRRSLQKTLGLLWLLDAGLQAQRYMFTAAFGRDVLGAAADGQAGFVARPVDWAARVVAAHPLPWNCVFVLVQLSLGAGLAAPAITDLPRGPRLQPDVQRRMPPIAAARDGGRCRAVAGEVLRGASVMHELP